MYSKYMMYSGKTSSWSKTNHCLCLGLHPGPASVLEEKRLSDKKKTDIHDIVQLLTET